MNNLWKAGPLLAIGSFVAMRAYADDLWMTLEDLGPKLTAVVKYGHPGERESTDPHRLVELVMTGTQPQSLLGRVQRGEREHVGVLLVSGIQRPEQTELIAARYDNGIWSKVGDTWFNASRELLPAATESDWSQKYAKALVMGVRASEAFRHVIGHPVELVPQADPSKLKKGGTLPVLVLFHGKPLVGGLVENGDGHTIVPEDKLPRYKTGPDGVAQVLIDHSGLQLLAIDYSVPAANPSTTPASLFNATFAFVVAP